MLQEPRLSMGKINEAASHRAARPPSYSTKASIHSHRARPTDAEAFPSGVSTDTYFLTRNTDQSYCVQLEDEYGTVYYSAYLRSGTTGRHLDLHLGQSYVDPLIGGVKIPTWTRTLRIVKGMQSRVRSNYKNDSDSVMLMKCEGFWRQRWRFPVVSAATDTEVPSPPQTLRLEFTRHSKDGVHRWAKLRDNYKVTNVTTGEVLAVFLMRPRPSWSHKGRIVMKSGLEPVTETAIVLGILGMREWLRRSHRRIAITLAVVVLVASTAGLASAAALGAAGVAASTGVTHAPAPIMPLIPYNRGARRRRR